MNPSRPNRGLPVKRLLPVALACVLLGTLLGLRADAEAQGGTLVAVGGGSENVELMQDVIELARGRASKVLIVNTASGNPTQSGTVYTRFFQQSLGVSQVSVLPLLSREQAYEPTVIEAIAQADLIYATGGNQIRLVQTITGTPAHGALLAAWQRGVVLAGTSAGAMVWGPSYITSGASVPALQRGIGPGSLEVRDGLAVLPNAIIDTHFGREGRLGRLLLAAAQTPRMLGVGVDEGTAAVFTAEGVRVLGSGRVTVLDVAKARVTTPARGPVSIRDVDLHTLSAGETFRWRRENQERAPMLPSRGREPLGATSLWLQGGDALPPPAWFAGLGSSFRGPFWPLPDELLILAGHLAMPQAQAWQRSLAAEGRTTLRVLSAAQVRSPILRQYLGIAGGVVLLDDADGSLANALMGEPGQLLRQAATSLQVVAAGGAVGTVGEPATRGGTGLQDLSSGLRIVPGVITSADVWAPGSLDRLVVDAMLAGGALGVGLSSNNGVRIESGQLRVWGETPAVVVETGRVSLANPALASARDLKLHVLAPGQDLKL
ncbi:MAG: cyanophycinase [Candidatus Sericytochromatia bacterium]|nr:cyanophycinase [Candidatus Sericytochromatia bacterium]